MGFGGLLNQLSTTTAGGGMGAVIENYPVASGYTISAGDVVDVNEEGEVLKTVTEEANEENVILSNNTTNLTAIKLNDNQVVAIAAYTNQINYCNVILVDAQNGERIATYSFPASASSKNSCARLNDTKFIVGWGSGLRYYAVIGQVSGVSITNGNSVMVSSVSSADEGEVFLVALDENRAVFVGVFSGQLKVVVLSISGTTITAGQEYPISSGNNIGNVSATLLPDGTDGSKRLCICFSKELSGNKGCAVIASIDSDNGVTVGSEAIFNNAFIGSVDCCTYGEDVVVLYTDQSLTGYAKVLQINQNEITIGTAIATVYAANCNHVSMPRFVVHR